MKKTRLSKPLAIILALIMLFSLLPMTALAASSEATLTSSVWTVNDTAETITDIPYGTTLADFKAEITTASGAGFEVCLADGQTAATDLQTDYKVIVTAEDGMTTKTYTITVAAEEGANDGDTEPVTLATAPTVSSAATSNETQIVLTMSGVLTNTQGDPSAFTVGGVASYPSVTAVAVSGTTVTLTLSAAIVSTDTPTVSYTAHGNNDLTDGTLVANFSNQAVTNNIPAEVFSVPFTAKLGNGTALTAALCSDEESVPKWTLNVPEGTETIKLSFLDENTYTSLNDYSLYNYIEPSNSINDFNSTSYAEGVYTVALSEFPIGSTSISDYGFSDTSASYAFIVVADLDGNAVLHIMVKINGTSGEVGGDDEDTEPFTIADQDGNTLTLQKLVGSYATGGVFGNVTTGLYYAVGAATTTGVQITVSDADISFCVTRTASDFKQFSDGSATIPEENFSSYRLDDPASIFDSDITDVTGTENLVYIDLVTELSTKYGIIVSLGQSAEAPSIDADLSTDTVKYNVNSMSTALEVFASINAGKLSYQWYSNTENSTIGGTPVEGATVSTYTPATTAAGITYYYVVVTNSEDGKNDKSATSAITPIVVVDPTSADLELSASYYQKNPGYDDDFNRCNTIVRPLLDDDDKYLYFWGGGNFNKSYNYLYKTYLEGNVQPGATVTVDGDYTSVDGYGHFEYMVYDGGPIRKYEKHEITVTSPDGNSTDTTYVFVFYGNYDDRDPNDNWPVVTGFIDEDGNDLQAVGSSNPGYETRTSGTGCIGNGRMSSFEVGNAMDSAHVTGTLKKDTAELKIYKLSTSTGALDLCGDAVIGKDKESFTTGELSFDVGLNIFFIEQKVAGSDEFVPYGAFSVLRQEAGLSSDISFDAENSLTITDQDGTVLTPVWDAENARWQVDLLSGGSDKNATITLTTAPTNNVSLSWYTSGNTAKNVSFDISIDYLREPNNKLYNLTVIAEDGLHSQIIAFNLTRPGWEPESEADATKLYTLSCSLYNYNGGWLGNPILSRLNADGTRGVVDAASNRPVGIFEDDFLGYIVDVDQNRGEQKDLYKFGISASATYGEFESVTVDSVPLDLESQYNTYGFNFNNQIHSGNSTFGSDNEPCTKIEITVKPPADSGYTESKTYTLIIPKEQSEDFDVTDLSIINARNADDDEYQLYTLGSNLSEKTEFDGKVMYYELKTSCNINYLYFYPSCSAGGIESKWTLNGANYTQTQSVKESGLDAVIGPLNVGENTVVLTLLNKGTDGKVVASKTYTFKITREADCNADFSFSDNVEFVAGSEQQTVERKVLAYSVGESLFSTTITANADTRTITVVQGDVTKGTGTGTLTVNDLSLFEEAAVTISDAESGASNSYQIQPYALAALAPTSVYAAMPAPGQFLNSGWSNVHGVRFIGSVGQSTDENVGGSGGASLGSFGGYITYYFGDPILNGPYNKYGADFCIGGNAFAGNNEPAGIKVAQDLNNDGKPDTDEYGNEIWYDLAGSRHYEDDTIWDYEVTYTNENPDFMPYIPFDVPYTDNLGNSGISVRANSFHPQSNFPDAENYAFEGNAANDDFSNTEMTYSGVLLDAGQVAGRGVPVLFGYAECVDTSMDSAKNGYKYTLESGNPYMGDTSKFDIDWAVDSNGEPIRLDSVSFIKVTAASLFDKDATGELSPEIMGFTRLDKSGNTQAVGRTPAPDSIVFKAAGFDDITISGADLPDAGGVYELDVGDRQFIQTIVNSQLNDAIIVNASRTSSGKDYAAIVEVTSVGTRLVRVTIQRGEMEAYSVLFKLTGTAEVADTALTDLAVNRNGAAVDGLSRVGALAYELTVPSNYGVLQVVPVVKDGATVTVNGDAPNDNGYMDVTLNAAGSVTAITIVTMLNGETETTRLTVTREADSSGDSDTYTATIAIEKFTLGQGYIVEPTQVTFTKGDTAADVTRALLGASGYISNMNSQYGFYLSDIYDPDRGGLNIPTFITDALSAAGVPLNLTDIDPDWLGEFDYTGSSGWMITVDNLFIPVSAGSWELEDGDVIRWQFTLYGLGADVGNSSPDSEYGGQSSIIPATNKDMLTRRIAEINGMGSITELLKAGSNQEAYDKAITILENLESTQTEIDAALSELYNLASIGTPTTASASEGAVVTLTATPTVTNGAASASVSKAEIDAILASAQKEGTTGIVIDAKTTQSVTKSTFELPAGSITGVASAGMSMKVETSTGTFDMTNDALGAIAAKGSGAVEFSAEQLGTDDLSDANKALVGSHPVFDLSITVGGTKVTDFGDGAVLVSLPYTPANGEDDDNLTVYFLDANGNAVEMEGAYYDKSSGCIVFVTNHFSRFAVVYEAWTNPFTDVKSGDWFYSAMKYVSQHDLFNGTTATTFGPDVKMSRAMFVTVLHRLDGKPSVTGTNSFADVKSGQWYTDAVLWADVNGIVTGYDSGLFGTDDIVTREQMAGILYNYAKYKGYDVTKTDTLAAFTDTEDVSSWALTAIKWAVSKGYITGTTTTTLSPAIGASRASVATILMRFAKDITQ